MNSREAAGRGKDEGIQCHFISNTHWDREWLMSMQRTRYGLVYMLDMLLDILDKDDGFRSFHLDSQTVPIEDYLEIRPERESEFRRRVAEGRIFIGPWYVLPDEFCISGEALVRNLLLGHHISRQYGGVSKTGYSPFSWGQCSQMPQIYNGFGIDTVAFYRGVNTLVAPGSEFFWDGADGTRVLATRLAARPRYNVWYILQRPAYWDQLDIDDKAVSWQAGNGPFKFAGGQFGGLEYRYARPGFRYHPEHIPGRVEQALAEQDQDCQTRHRFWSAGHDASVPDIREVRMMADADNALGDRGRVFHSTVKAFFDGLKAEASADWPVAQGEMRHPMTKGSSSGFLGWIISSRLYIKRENFMAERDLWSYAEPAAVLASFLGAPYPRAFLDRSARYLLQNHGHDSIAGCGRDVTVLDVMDRFRQSREISSCVFERAFMDLAGAINYGGRPASSMALLVYNPSAISRSEVVDLAINLPREWQSKALELRDGDGRLVPFEIAGTVKDTFGIVWSPNDTGNYFPADTLHVRALLPQIPGLGWRTFFVSPAGRGPARLPSLRTGPASIENEYLRADFHRDGTLDLLDKEGGHWYRKLHWFRDTAEVGDPWIHRGLAGEAELTTLGSAARIRVTEGALAATVQVDIDWQIPAGATGDYKERRPDLVAVAIHSEFTLRSGSRWLEVETTIDNRAECHYLQVVFPTDILAETVHAQGQFDVLARPTALPDARLFEEEPMTEAPMNDFVDLSDGRRGLAILNRGLKAYSAAPDGTLALTLIRAYPFRLGITSSVWADYNPIEKGSQCLGLQRCSYALMPHQGDWEEGQVWEASEAYARELQAAQVGPVAGGNLPLMGSFLELEPPLRFQALKQADGGDGWVMRVINPSGRTVRGRLRLNGGQAPADSIASPVERLQADFALPGRSCKPWGCARELSLEELPRQDLVMDSEGWVSLEAGPKQILTVLFSG
jgi:hypothetical protein